MATAIKQLIHSYQTRYVDWEVGVTVYISLYKYPAISVIGAAKADAGNPDPVPIYVDLTYNNNVLVTAQGSANELTPAAVYGANITDLTEGMPFVLKLSKRAGTYVDPNTQFVVTVVELDPMAGAAVEPRKRKK